MLLAWIFSPMVVLTVVVILVLSQCVRIVEANQMCVMELFGKYTRTLRGGGIFVTFPFESMHCFNWSWPDPANSERLHLETRYWLPTYQIPMNPPNIRVRTLENYSIDVDIQFFFTVVSGEDAAYKNGDPLLTMYTISQTTLSALASNATYDEIQTHQEAFAKNLQDAMNKDAVQYGLEVHRVVIERIIADKIVQAETRKGKAQMKSLSLGVDVEKRHAELDLLKEMNLMHLQEMENTRIVVRADAEANAYAQRLQKLSALGVDVGALLRAEAWRDGMSALASSKTISTLCISTEGATPPTMHIHTQTDSVDT